MSYKHSKKFPNPTKLSAITPATLGTMAEELHIRTYHSGNTTIWACDKLALIVETTELEIERILECYGYAVEYIYLHKQPNILVYSGATQAASCHEELSIFLLALVTPRRLCSWPSMSHTIQQ